MVLEIRLGSVNGLVGGLSVNSRGNEKDRHQRRARAQPQEHRRRDPARQADRHHRAVGSGSRRSPSTPSTPRGSAATSSRCRPTRGSSSSRWTSPTSTRSRACRRRSRSSRRPLAESALDRRHGHRDLRLPAPALGAHRHRALLRAAGSPSPRRPSSRWSTGCSSCPRASASRCWRRWCATQGRIQRSSAKLRKQASCASTSTASSTSCPSR